MRHLHERCGNCSIEDILIDRGMPGNRMPIDDTVQVQSQANTQVPYIPPKSASKGWAAKPILLAPDMAASNVCVLQVKGASAVPGTSTRDRDWCCQYRCCCWHQQCTCCIYALALSTVRTYLKHEEKQLVESFSFMILSPPVQSLCDLNRQPSR